MRDQVIAGRSSVSYHPQNKIEESQTQIAVLNESKDPNKEDQIQIDNLKAFFKKPDSNPNRELAQKGMKEKSPSRGPSSLSPSRGPSSLPSMNNNEVERVCTLKKWHLP